MDCGVHSSKSIWTVECTTDDDILRGLVQRMRMELIQILPNKCTDCGPENGKKINSFENPSPLKNQSRNA